MGHPGIQDLHCLPISISVGYFPVMATASPIDAIGFHSPLYGEEGATQHWVIPGVGWHKPVGGEIAQMSTNQVWWVLLNN